MAKFASWVAMAAVVAGAGLVGCGKKDEAPKPAAGAPAASAPAAAPAAPAAKVQAGKWSATTEMGGSMGAQAQAGMEQAIKNMTPEQKKAANLENARFEGGKLIQEMCITPEMASKTLQAVADSQLKNVPGCNAPELKTDGNKETMSFSCSEGKMTMVLEAVYTSPTENTVTSKLDMGGQGMQTTVNSKRICDC